jgi:predicted Zn-dependent protease
VRIYFIPSPSGSDRKTAGGGVQRLLILAGAVALFCVAAIPASAQAPAPVPTTLVVHLPVSTLPRMPQELTAPPVSPPAVGSDVAGASHHTNGKYDVQRIGERGIGSGLNLYSIEREQALGRELSQQVEAQAKLIKDPVITEYVNRVAQSIVRNSDARVPFTVKVVDNDEVNAFALPGGFFYVDTGLILAADNEAELAGVMAHEIAHVAARHATKTATRAQIFNLASIPLIFMGGPAGYAVRQIAGLAVPMSFLKFSRDAEREADLLGLEYAYAAGYDPAEFVHFFESLQVKQKQKLSFVAKAFATHPMTNDRIQRAQKEIATMLPEKDQYVVSTSEFEEIKTRLTRLENAHHLNGGKIETPVLRRRQDRPAADDKQDKQDDEQPTLKRP